MVSLYWFNAAGLRRRLICSSTCTHKKATQFGLQRFDQRTKLDLLITIVNILFMGFLGSQSSFLSGIRRIWPDGDSVV